MKEEKRSMSKNSSSDAVADNGKEHGELYSPEYAIHINTEQKEKERKIEGGQGELYSPESALQISTSQQKKQDSDKQQQLVVKEAEAKSRKGKDEERNGKQNPETRSKSSSSKPKL